MTAPPIGVRESAGRVRLDGLAIHAPGWREEIDAWCQVVGLDPPGSRRELGPGLGLVRRRALSITLVDQPAGSPPDGSNILYLVATTDDLDAALARAASHGSPLIGDPGVDETGRRVAVVKGPVGMAVRIVERRARIRLAGPGPLPRRAEAHLKLNAAATGIVALSLAGYFANLAVERAPHRQVSFGFLIGFCTLFAVAAAFVGYPNGMMAGDDGHARGLVRTLRSEVAGVDPVDRAGAGWAGWNHGLRAALAAGAASVFILGVASAALLGRPIGFWLLWGWTAAVAGSSMVMSSTLGTRRGLLTAGRRAHGLAVAAGEPVPVVRRAWRMGALPLAVFSATVNAGLAWTAYRYGTTGKALGSDLLGSVAVTGAVNYLMGRQWGRADWRAGRVSVPAAMHLPHRLRLAPQGLLLALIAELILLNLAGHALASPPQLAGAVLMRSLAGMVAGGTGFGLGSVAGVLNAAADEREAT